MNPSDEERVTALEVRYAHLEHLVGELSQVVFEQHKAMDRMGKELFILRNQLAGVETGPKQEPPPHY
jgi:uncharacterized coiled-coil protein SlyX